MSILMKCIIFRSKTEAPLEGGQVGQLTPLIFGILNPLCLIPSILTPLSEISNRATGISFKKFVKESLHKNGGNIGFKQSMENLCHGLYNSWFHEEDLSPTSWKKYWNGNRLYVYGNFSFLRYDVYILSNSCSNFHLKSDPWGLLINKRESVSKMSHQSL